MANIFISHSSKDNRKTKEIFDDLSKISKSIFLDFDSSGHGLKGGDDWEKTLYKRIKKARIMIIALSPNWLDSQWCYKEYCMARVLRKKIIPVVIEEDKRIYSWDGKDIQHYDTTRDSEALEKLKKRIEELTLHEITKLYDTKKIESPYPGLRSFNKEEAGIFYGRNDEILEAIDILNALADSGEQKFLNIVGASGVGKSSFLKAGLLPLLELLHHENWYVLPTFRAKQEILLNLAKTLSLFDYKAGEVLDAIKGEGYRAFFDELELALFESQNEPNQKILLPIDQAEEILNSESQEEKEQFFKIVQYLIEQKANFFIVWTLRSDHLNLYQAQKSLEFLRDKERVYILNPIAFKELHNIIQEPAFVNDIIVKDDVVEAIKEDIKTTTSLPLLAYLLQILYKNITLQQQKSITIDNYKALAKDGKNPIENIINQEADEIYATHKNKREIEELFVNHLVKINQDESFSKRSEMLNNIPPTLHALVNRFVQKRLLIKDTDKEGQVTVEIVHEALITNWSVLKGWLSKEREFLILKSQLFQALKEWEDTNRDDKALLFGLRLENAVKYKEKLNNKEQEYVERSYKYAKKQKRAKKIWISSIIATLIFASLFMGWSAYKAKLSENKAQLSEKKAQNLTYNSLMQQGVTYRDYLPKPLKAKHIFAKAIKNSTNKEQLRNAKISYASIKNNIKLKNIFEHNSSVEGIQISKDEKQILSWSGNTVKLWNRESDRPLRVFKHDSDVWGAKFSKNEKQILSWSMDKTVKLWSIESDKPLRVFKHNGAVFGAQFSKNEKQILSWSRDKTVKLWSIESDKPLRVFKHNKSVNGVQFSKDGKQILSWSWDKTVKLWSIESNKPLRVFKHNKSVNGVQFSKDEKQILSWSWGTVKLWSIESNKPLRVFKHDSDVWGAKFSKNEKQILSWSRDKTVKLWSIESNKPLRVFKHNSSVRGAQFSKDEKQILSWSWGTVKLWSIESDKPLRVFKHNGAVFGAQFSKDEKQILSWGGVLEGEVKLWSIESDRPLRVFKHNSSVRGAQFSKDEKQILSWSDDNTVKLWSIESDKPLRVFKHNESVNGAQFSKDGKQILSWSDDGKIKLWSIESNKPLRVFKHNGYVIGAQFSKDEKQILSWGADGEIKLFNLYPNEGLTKEQYQLKLEVDSGTYLTDSGEVKALSKDEWLKKKRLYEKEVKF